MRRPGAQPESVLQALERAGGTGLEQLREVARETTMPEAEVAGVASFYHLLQPAQRRVCQGLSCQLHGELPDGTPVSCLGRCDQPVPVIGARHELLDPQGPGAVLPDDPGLPINLGGADTADYAALARVRAMGAEAFLDELAASGLQGRGGAAFPAAAKWRSVRSQAVTERYVVCNADEGEPGTFKDREVMLRRPHRLLEGLAIAAWVAQADDIYLYIRGEFRDCRRALEAALESAPALLGHTGQPLRWHFADGHGAYICGEETALLEAMEGRRGMPRMKPPFPTEQGFRGKPTLMNNVETLACVPFIALQGGAAFKALGRTEAGSKLYCVSGHVWRPGVYELPLGVTLDELVQAAGGYVGTPLAFSPGGASSGFLPMTERQRPMDFRSLQEVGCMLGSAGVVVLNDTVDMARAALWQLRFFEDESCGQCAPCRIGTRMLHRAAERYLQTGDPAALDHTGDVAWEMETGSICGLGMVAAVPLTSAMRHFPRAFGKRGPHV